MVQEEEADWIDRLPPLVRASALGETGKVEELLRRGSSPDEADETGWSALHASATRGHAEIVQALVSAGANFERCDQDGSSPLLNAAGPTPSARTVKLLLDAGSDPNSRNGKRGWSPLSRAVDYENVDVVRHLLDHHADPRSVDADGFTLLMQAAESGSIPIAKLLLAAGAQPDILCDGETAADIARTRGHDEFARFVQKY